MLGIAQKPIDDIQVRRKPQLPLYAKGQWYNPLNTNPSPLDYANAPQAPGLLMQY